MNQESSNKALNRRKIGRSMSMEELLATMIPVLKKELAIFGAANVIQNMSVLTIEGGYVLTFYLRNVNEQQVLAASRGKLRKWVSLDSLVAFLRAHGLSEQLIILQLVPRKDIDTPPSTKRRTRRKAIL